LTEDLFDPIEAAQRQWEAASGARVASAMAATTAIMRVQQILMNRLNDLIRPYELSFPRYEVLMLLHLSRRGALSLGKIGDRLQVHRASVTSMIDGLEASGFVHRVRPVVDRRRVLAEIRPAGRRAALEATAVLNAELFGLAVLGDEELGALSRMLRRVRAEAGDIRPRTSTFNNA